MEYVWMGFLMHMHSSSVSKANLQEQKWQSAEIRDLQNRHDANFQGKTRSQIYLKL